MKHIKLSFLLLIFILSSVYVLSSFYLAFKIHVFLPAADLHDHMEFLLDSYKNGLTKEIFSIHNGFHWIVIPKIVLAIDMHYFNGNGWFIKGVSLVTFLLTLLIVSVVIYKTPGITKYQKICLIFLMLAVMGGPWVLESLVNPISQYSMLFFFLVSLAFFSTTDLSKNINKIGLTLSLLLLLMSSGQALALVPAFIFLKYPKQSAKIICFSLIAGFLVIFSDFLFSCLLHKVPLFYGFYLEGIEYIDLSHLKNRYFDSPFISYFSYIGSVFYFLYKLTFNQSYGAVTPVFFNVLSSFFYVFAFLVIAKHKYKWKIERFWIVCFWFCFTTALLAGVLRTADFYSNRFSNIGCLLLVSLGMYFVLYRQGKYTNHIIVVLTLYLLSVLQYNYKDIEQVNQSSLAESAVRSQVAYSVGVKNEKLISNSHWLLEWEKIVSKNLIHYYPDWKNNGLGVFSTNAYKVFSGFESLPTQMAHCNYSVEKNVWHSESEDGKILAVRMQGMALSTSKISTRYAVFYSDENKAIGRAVENIGKSLRELLFEPAGWDGYLTVPNLDKYMVKIVAYDNDFQCQPYEFELKKKKLKK